MVLPARSLGRVAERPPGSRGRQVRLGWFRHGHVLDVGRRAAGGTHGGTRTRPTFWVGVRASGWGHQVVLVGVGQLEAPQEPATQIDTSHTSANPCTPRPGDSLIRNMATT